MPEGWRRPANSPPLVSIVIPTKDVAGTLPRTLASLAAQTYRRIEVIVVDNGSTDGTQGIAEGLGARLLHGGPERSAQVNIGVAASRGEYVYRIDGDFVLPSELVAEAVRTAELSELDAVIIHNSSDPSAGFWAFARNFEREMYRNDRLNVAARFFRRDMYERLGGYDEHLVAGEDYDLHRRLMVSGAVVGRIEIAEVHVGEPKTVMDVVRKHYFYGAELRRYVRKHGMFAVRQLSPLRPAFFHNWRDLLRKPRSVIAFMCYLVIKYLAGAAGFAFGRGRMTGAS